MRARPVKNLEEKKAALAHLLLVPDREMPGAAEHPGRWYEREVASYIIPEEFASSPIYVEFGCGKGDFINALSQTPVAKSENALMIGIEGGGGIILAAMRKTEAAGFSNVRYIDRYVNAATEAFALSSLDGIFLNFSDPWPKDRHADRRLTAPSKAAAYLSVLKPGGFAALKTDSKILYEYSRETFRDAGFITIFETTELEADFTPPPAEDAAAPGVEIPYMALCGMRTRTEYERRFRGVGYPIYCLVVRKAMS